MRWLAVVANVEPVVAGQPGNRAFDHPSVTTEPLGRLDAFASDPDADTSAVHPLTQVCGIVGFVGVQLAGLRRRGPRRDRTAEIALTSGRSACASLVLAAETPTDRGIPVRSDRTWIFEPDLPRSTGLGPVTGRLFWLAPTPHRLPLATSRPSLCCPARPARPSVIAARDRLRSTR